MRKIWVDRDTLYSYKPFYRRKIFFLFLCFIITVVYFAYQIFYLNKLSARSMETTQILVVDDDPIEPSSSRAPLMEIPRGIRLRDLEAYSSKLRRLFRCLDGSKEIPHDHVNDDWCDCRDGSDEPGTSACPNGMFYCRYQARHKTGRGAYEAVPSGRVNDGICDCCDGSDEYGTPNSCPITCR